MVWVLLALSSYRLESFVCFLDGYAALLEALTSVQIKLLEFIVSTFYNNTNW